MVPSWRRKREVEAIDAVAAANLVEKPGRVIGERRGLVEVLLTSSKKFGMRHDSAKAPEVRKHGGSQHGRFKARRRFHSTDRGSALANRASPALRIRAGCTDLPRYSVVKYQRCNCDRVAQATCPVCRRARMVARSANSEDRNELARTVAGRDGQSTCEDGDRIRVPQRSQSLRSHPSSAAECDVLSRRGAFAAALIGERDRRRNNRR